MPALLYSGAMTAVSNIIQLLAGCLLASVVHRIFVVRPVASSRSFRSSFLLILLFSLCGILMPFGLYGVIPLVAVALAVGFNGYAVSSLVVSNVLFNLTVPFHDPGFVWRTGYRQVILAFVAGVLAGLLLYTGKRQAESFFRQRNLPVPDASRSMILGFLRMTDDSIKKLGLFLAAGAIAESIFRGYLLSVLLNAFYYTSFTASIPVFFARQDVTNPFFLLVFVIVYMLMNMVNLSALLAMLKPKGIAAYFVYFILWAFLLAIPAFL